MNAQSIPTISTTSLDLSGTTTSAALQSVTSPTYFANDGQTFLVLRGGVVATTAKIKTFATSIYQAGYGFDPLADITVTLPSATTVIAGPFPTGRWNDPTTGLVRVEFTSITTVSGTAKDAGAIMAETLRNEVAVTLEGTEYTLRATFSAIRGIERDLKTNLVPLIEKLGRGDVGIEQAAVIVFHGLRGYEDTSLTLDQVGELIMKTGLGEVMLPVVDFLSKAMQGVSLGKPAAETAA